ncbi:RAD9, HUS1, RAD1-interacting nuclear orphan protein 1 [Rhinoraja longicauda]
MPRKKKTIRSKKPPLLFVESPLKREQSKQVQSLPSVTNPRQVSCIPADQRSAFTWVLPEFQTTTAQGPRRDQKSDRAKQRCSYNKASAPSKTRSVKKLHVNFVPLTFVGSGGIPVQKKNHNVQLNSCQQIPTHGQAKFQANKSSLTGSGKRGRGVYTFGKAQNSEAFDKQEYRERFAAKRHMVGKSTVRNTAEKSSGLCPPMNGINDLAAADSDETEISFSENLSRSSDEAFTLPQVSTPTLGGLSSPAIFKKDSCNRLRNSGLNKHKASPGLLVLDKSSGRKDDFSAHVLVQDTPEHEYGLKITWQRRPRIMRYLMDQGNLNTNDVFVGS